ncbi:MAG: cupin domain-containing protein [Anaerolineae bacterium]
MLQKLDLAAIAESIAAPYRLVPLVSLGAVEAALVVCGGPKKWQRSAQRDELLVVLEGHVTIEGNGRRVIANEGDVATIPSSITLAWWSGMRSIAVLCQERDRPFNANGYHGPPTGDRELAGRTEFAAHVRAGPALRVAA